MDLALGFREAMAKATFGMVLALLVFLTPVAAGPVTAYRRWHCG